MSNDDAFAERIGRALGSSRIVQLENLPSGGPLDLLHLSALAASGVFLGRDWLSMMPMEVLEASTTYQQIRLRGIRELLASMLTARLGAGAETLVARFPNATGDVLERAGSLVATMRSDEELMTALDALLPRG